MKKIISLVMAVTIFLTMSNIVFAEKEKNEDANMKPTVSMTIRGTEYYQGMPLTERKEQLDYTLKIDEFEVDNQDVKLSGSIFNQSGKIAEISDDGLLYKSQKTLLQKVNGLTILFPRKENWQILSCTLEKNAFDGELLIANMEMAGKPVIKIAVQNKDKIYYFEGELPVGFDYDSLYAAAKNPSEEKKISEIDERFIIGDGSVSEYEIIQYEDGWRTSSPLQSNGVTVLDNESDEMMISQTNAVSPIEGVPVNVFTQAGKWASVNNPNKQTMGYYAVTNQVNDTNNYKTQIIKWEYIYPECNNFEVGDKVAYGGATQFRIHEAYEYTYFASRNEIELTNTFITYRIKNAAVAMGLQSDEQILGGVNRTMEANGRGVNINWKSILGLLPLGQYYSTAVTLFNSISFVEKNVSSSEDIFQDTAKGQKDVYGKLIRGYKMTDNGKYFIKNGDRMGFTFQVRQPSDLGRTVRRNSIANKFYFEIYERNPMSTMYTDMVYSVNQIRNSYYNVY